MSTFGVFNLSECLSKETDNGTSVQSRLDRLAKFFKVGPRALCVLSLVVERTLVDVYWPYVAPLLEVHVGDLPTAVMGINFEFIAWECILTGP